MKCDMYINDVKGQKKLFYGIHLQMLIIISTRFVLENPYAYKLNNTSTYYNIKSCRFFYVNCFLYIYFEATIGKNSLNHSDA